MPPISAVVFGAGQRGNIYGEFALQHPRELSIVAVAEPDEFRRSRFAGLHDIPENQCYESWTDLIDAGKQADVVFNATMDQMHIESTLAALEQGYDVLLEKPMAHTLEGNVRLVQVAEEKGRLLQVSHVLRYAPFFETLREIIRSGRLGEIISVDHRENLPYYHMAHSFVRGNWRNLATSAPMILAKCCHDLDILTWMLGKRVAWLNSFGSLSHFNMENAPHPDVPERCTDGCPVADTCKYDAQRFYVRDTPGSFWNAVTYEATEAARLEALKTGPYGRCVYRCDNDVVDHQTVNMEMEDGATVTLIMNGQGYEEGRSLRIDGTKATLLGKFVPPYKIIIHDHLSGKKEQVPIIERDSSGHGGGDFGLIRSFVNALKGVPDDSLTTARESLESHLLAYAAEESRLQHSIIEMGAFREQAEVSARKAFSTS